MSEMKRRYTPGPWALVLLRESVRRYEIHGDYKPYPHVAFVKVAGHESDEANTRLMAAAPDLLEALKSYVDWFGAAHEDGCPGDDTCACKCKILNDAVNAAIAKAESLPADHPGGRR